MAIQPQVIQVINNASITNSTTYILTSTGAFTDTQTITINGVVFTTNTVLAGAGSVLIGGSAATTITNLAAAINAPNTTTTNFTALSNTNANTLIRAGVIAVATSATILTISSTNNTPLTVSETQTNAAFTFLTTSSGFANNVQGKASVQFTAASITSGNGVFTVEVSNDGTNWVVYSRLTTNVTNTNAQTDTRVASVTLSSNGSSVVFIPDPCAFYRVKVAPTTDGTYSATAYVI